ncbi:MAG: tetratricopeptide repeat-containing sensor histidine kinase [bacterium]
MDECWKNRSNNSQLALKRGHEALELSRKISNKSFEAKTLNLISVVYRATGQNDISLDYAQHALSVAQECKDSVSIAYAENNIGGSYRIKGFYTIALRHVFTGLEIFSNLNDKFGMAFCTINIGFIYRLQFNYNKALSYFQQTFSIRKEIGDRSGQAIALRWIANAYTDMGDYEMALKKYSQLESEYSDLDYKAEMEAIWKGMGLIFLRLKNYSEAQKYLANSLELAKQLGNVSSETSNRNNLAIVLSNLGRFEEAENHLILADNLATQINDTELILEGYDAYSQFYELKKDYQNSLKYANKFHFLKDSIITKYNILSANELETIYRSEQAKRNNAILMKNIEISENQKKYLILISIMFIISSFVIYGRFHFKKRANKRLHELNALKDKFFGIIAHDLRNPFSAIFSLAKILKEDYNELTDSERIELINSIESTGEKTFKLLENLLYWSLSQTGRMSYNPKQQNLSQIIDDTVKLFEGPAKNKNISLVSNKTEETAVGDEEMIKAVLRNLISNAIKYTIPGGKVSVQVNRKNELVYISIIDTGIGIEEDIRKNIFQIDNISSMPGTGGEKGTGLGLALCNEFVKKNNGDIQVESEPGKGSKFTFSLRSRN